MCRLQTLQQIDNLIIGSCGPCNKRSELVAKYGKRFSHIDTYCNKECPTGKKLQELGSMLIKESPARKNSRGKQRIKQL